MRLGDALDGRLGELSKVLVVLQLLRLVSQQRRLAELLGLGLLLLLLSFGVVLEGELRGALVEVNGFLYLRLGPSSSSSCSAADSDPNDRLVRLRLAAGLALARFVAAELDSAATSNDSRDGDGILGIGGSLVLADLRGLGAGRTLGPLAPVISKSSSSEGIVADADGGGWSDSYHMCGCVHVKKEQPGEHSKKGCAAKVDAQGSVGSSTLLPACGNVEEVLACLHKASMLSTFLQPACGPPTGD